MSTATTKTKSVGLSHFLEKATEIASHYGFHHSVRVLAQKNTAVAAKRTLRAVRELPHEARTLSDPICDSLIAPIMPFYTPLETEPIMIYDCGRQTAKKKQIVPTPYLRLEIFGVRGSIAEALLLRTLLAILTELGHQSTIIDINSIGDRESLTRFLRDVTLYYRKNIDSLHASCKEKLRRNVLALFRCSHEKCEELRLHAPKPISFLSENSRKHFKEVLECLEIMEAPYQINDTFVGDSNYYTKTVFRVRTEEKEDRILACGGRYDDIARKMGGRSDLPAIGASLISSMPSAHNYFRPRAERKPRVYFIQIGLEAKRKGLAVLEMLRRAHVPVYQTLSEERLTGQLSQAEALSIPYTLIMGHKEALEETVIVRHTASRAQETVALSDLPLYLKKTTKR